MSFRIDDRWLWLGLGFVTFFAIKNVATGLREIVTLTEVHTPPPRPAIPPNTIIRGEDAIKTSSLEILALCNNIEIRKATTRILCERFMTDPTACGMLRNDLNNPNPERVRKARLALRLLHEFGVLRESQLPFSEIQDLSETPHPRRSRNSTEERDLRRRRREAIIVNEGDRPVSNEDVWMRDDMGRMNQERGTLDLPRLNADVVEEEVQDLLRALRPRDLLRAPEEIEEVFGEFVQDVEAMRLLREEAPSPPTPPFPDDP